MTRQSPILRPSSSYLQSQKTSADREPHPDDWRPNPGPQERFLTLTCLEALYGGSAGGGKSDAILIDAIRYVGRGYGPAYQALLLRRTFPDLEKSLIGRSHDLYPRLGATYNEQKKIWRFPGGERVIFGYLKRDKDVRQYQGAAFPFIGFDELTQFSRAQYTYLFSRCRSSVGIRCRIRGTTNPGGEGHEWVYERFGPWLNPNSELKAGSGEILYFIREDEKDVNVPKGTLDEDGHPASGRTFVRAKLEDNPYLAEDGSYNRALKELDPVEQERLRNGNWEIKPGKGLYFKRQWVTFIDSPPPGLQWVRAWDLAATPKTDDNDPDWTRGVKGAMWGDKIVIADVVSLRGGPGEVDDLILSTARMDGPECKILLPKDPAQAGVHQANSHARMLRGFNFKHIAPTGDKVVRFGPFSAQALALNVVIVRGDWTPSYIAELEAFPEGKKDQADATSDLFNEIVGMEPDSDYDDTFDQDLPGLSF